MKTYGYGAFIPQVYIMMICLYSCTSKFFSKYLR